jgi:hypothetical protein
MYENGSFIITWSQNNDNDFLSYSLYESETDDIQNGNLIFETEDRNDTTYATATPEVGDIKYYWIAVADLFGLVTTSDIKKAQLYDNLNFSINYYYYDELPVVADGIIFFSDLNGNLINDTTWNGNTTFDWNWTNGLGEIPGNVSITFVIPIYSFDSVGNEYILDIILYTYLDINPSAWSIEDLPPYWPEYTDPVTLEFENVPDHTGYLVSGFFGSSNSGEIIYSPVELTYLRTNPDDLFIVLNTVENGPRYKWYNNVFGGNSYTVDLSSLSPMQSTTITYPNVDNINYSIYGFLSDNVHWTERYKINGNYITPVDTVNSIVTVYYSEDFVKFRSFLYMYGDDSYNTSYRNSMIGPIPSEFQQINADFEYISYDYNNYSISTSGTFDVIYSYWRGGLDNNSTWYVYGPPELTDYKLPDLPNSAQQIYGINKSSFSCISTYLRQYPNLNGYEGFVDAQKSSENFYGIYGNRIGFLKYSPSSMRTNSIHLDSDLEEEN